MNKKRLRKLAEGWEPKVNLYHTLSTVFPKYFTMEDNRYFIVLENPEGVRSNEELCSYLARFFDISFRETDWLLGLTGVSYSPLGVCARLYAKDLKSMSAGILGFIKNPPEEIKSKYDHD